MKKHSTTELVFVLDCSGSMSGLEDDTIGGFNSLLTKQQEQEGEAFITTVLFNHQYKLLHDRINLKAVGPISREDYCTQGSTALLDAIGRSIEKIKNAHKRTSADYLPEKVLIVITTDGMENSSREYSRRQVKNMIEHQTEEGWEFIFLGANIDAVETAGHFGIHADRAQNYLADPDGVMLNNAVLCECISTLRAEGSIPDNWNEKIEDDYDSRKTKQS